MAAARGSSPGGIGAARAANLKSAPAAEQSAENAAHHLSSNAAADRTRGTLRDGLQQAVVLSAAWSDAAKKHGAKRARECAAGARRLCGGSRTDAGRRPLGHGGSRCASEALGGPRLQCFGRA